MSGPSERAIAAIDELAAHTPPPADLGIDELLAAAEALAAKQRAVIDVLAPLGESERETVIKNPSVSSALDRLRASSDDWARALGRGRDSAAARVAAVRNFRGRGGYR